MNCRKCFYQNTGQPCRFPDCPEYAKEIQPMKKIEYNEKMIAQFFGDVKKTIAK